MLHLVFDTETTGLPGNSAMPLARQPQIIEYFGLLLDIHGEGDDLVAKEVDCLSLLINPGKKLPEIITKITSITDEMLSTAFPFAHQASKIEAFHARADFTIAHNLKFDRTLLDFEFRRLARPFDLSGRTICTVEVTEHIRGHRMKMGDLYEHLFGERFEGAHRAEADVRALGRIYVELMRRDMI